MGCCSSSRGASNDQSDVTAPEKNLFSPNADSVDPVALHQHQTISMSQDDESSDSSMQISRSFAQNKSIAREMMRLEEMEMDKNIDDLLGNVDETQNPVELKSNENSEDIRNSHDEPATQSVTINEAFGTPSPHHHQKGEYDHREQADSYTPFGLIQSQNSESPYAHNQKVREQNSDRIFEEEATKQTKKGEKIKDLAMDLEALYAENLKQHGFDADKFRNANVATNSNHQELDHDRFGDKNGGSSDMSSFASSELSSKSGTLRSLRSSVAGTGSRNLNIDEFIVEEEEEDDFMLQELSRADPKRFDHDDVQNMSMMERDIMPQREEDMGYIESIQHSVREGRSGSVHNIMDDDDEELMDAILSLDMDDDLI